MSIRPVFVILAALGLLVSSWLFPPWVVESRYAGGERLSKPIGFHSIFEVLPFMGRTNDIIRLDLVRLILLDLSIVAVAAGVVFATRQAKAGKS